MAALQKSYIKLSGDDYAEDLGETTTLGTLLVEEIRHQKHRNRVLSVLGLLSVILNILFLAKFSFASNQSSLSQPGYTGVDQTEQWQKFLWTTEYSSGNRTHADALWKGLRPGFGVVALDHEWAAARELPHSQDNPDDPTQGLYILDAYHQLHCLNMIRTSLNEFKDGKEQTFAFGHPTHCLDSLRQAVMCRADDTPLFTIGDFTTGDGQLRQCRDWRVLSDWAADHFPTGYHVPEYMRKTE